MSRTTADVLVERLIDWRVGVVFGLPGDGINGIIQALRTRQDRISFLSALEAMLLADGPALCEAIVDPFEPPMPARVTAKQALHMAEALAKGQPNRRRIALTLFRDKVHDFKGR